MHKQVLLLAIPMVLSNITVPLLGLVDAAVIGHLEHSWYLGGVALGGTMISVTFLQTDGNSGTASKQCATGFSMQGSGSRVSIREIAGYRAFGSP